MYRILCLATLFLITSCSRPHSPLPPVKRCAAPCPSFERPSCPLASEPSHLSLESALAIALDQNKDIRVIRQMVMKAREGKLEALSKWLPELEAVSLGYKTERHVVATGARSAFMSQLNTTQALINTEKWYDVKIANLVVKELQALLNAAIIDVLFQVRSLYYQLVFDQETIETAEQKVELLTSLAQEEQADYKIGTTILLNVNQAKVAIANAMGAYYDAVKRYKVDLDTFVRILGYDPGSIKVGLASDTIPIDKIPEIASKVEKVLEVFQEGDPEGPLYKRGYPVTQARAMQPLFSEREIISWESNALLYRPEVTSRKVGVEIANQEVASRRGEYWPKVNMEFNYGGYPNKMLDNPSSSFFNQNFHWALGYHVKWLLFDGFGRRHRIAKANHNRCAKRFEYQKSVQMAYEDVRKQIFEIEDGVASYVTAESNVRLAKQTLDLANSQLQIGYINVFDYQIVIDSLIEALNIRNRAEFDLIRGYYGLIHASGVDLSCAP